MMVWCVRDKACGARESRRKDSHKVCLTPPENRSTRGAVQERRLETVILVRMRAAGLTYSIVEEIWYFH